MRKLRLLPALLLALTVSPLARADFYVVVNEQNPVTMLTQQDVLQLFMGRTRAFPDGQRALTFDQASALQREGFYRSLSGMTLPQVTSYWARLMFSGRSLPPQQLADEEAVSGRVASDPRAVAWLTSAPKRKGLRTVLVLKDAQ